jgi:hypothetical protein
MQNESPLAGVFPNYPFCPVVARRQDSVAMMLEILIQLVRHEKDISVDSESVRVERKAYLFFDFYRGVFRDRYSNEQLHTLVCFAARNNPEFTESILGFLIEQLNRFSHSDSYIHTYLQVSCSSLR